MPRGSQVAWVAACRGQALGSEDLSPNQPPHWQGTSPGCIDRSLLSREAGTCSREFGTRGLGLVHYMWALLFCQVDLAPVASSDQQLDAAQGGGAQIRARDGVTRPGPAPRCGVPYRRGGPAPQTDSGEESSGETAASVSAGALPGVVMATAPAGARAASPQGLPAKRRTLLVPRGYGGKRGTGGGAERGEPLAGWGDAGWGRQVGSAVPDRYHGQPGTGGGAGTAAAGRGCCGTSEPRGLAFPGGASAPAGGEGAQSPPGERRGRAGGLGIRSGPGGCWRGLGGGSGGRVRRSPAAAGPGGSRLRVVLNGQRRRAAHARGRPLRAGACAGERGQPVCTGAAAGLEQPVCAGGLGSWGTETTGVHRGSGVR